MQQKFYKPYSQNLRKCLLIACLILTVSGCSIFKSSQKPNAAYGRLPDFSKEKSVGLEDISIAAIGLVGVPYRWGGNTPSGGFDCSGLIVYVHQNVKNQKLPRTTDQMAKVGFSLEDQPPSPGDLVFFNTTGGSHSHVGIYVGKGRFVHAPSTGGTVRLEEIRNPYWAPRYTEARRVAKTSSSTSN
jgi:cell wall-associated NlpC family hydrolase